MKKPKTYYMVVDQNEEPLIYPNGRLYIYSSRKVIKSEFMYNIDKILPVHIVPIKSKKK